MFFATTAHAATAQFRGNIGAMIIDADPVVKLVMLLLLIFSVASWTIIIQKFFGLHRARKRCAKVLDGLNECKTLSDMAEHVAQPGASPLARIFEDAQTEVFRITAKNQRIPASLLANVESRMDYAHKKERESLGSGLGFLASASNASPFIGLFGTVWGIMDSFRNIALMGSANLTTVAPGISEALIATAAGLFVAIPAVLFFNYFTGINDQITDQMELFSIDFMNWLRRGTVHGD